ncbi:cysteine desulfurase NifS [Rhodoblastus sphagnicola]|uniref:Cysteine desulfurase n=1 Tax=Rhodoblastus sphagnicola TaxID=333368 RepID=A0A2S6NDT1_9HYPH|nr:cysteine desulfurase family protein [Rhodoblastus sphagnicola]MBB4198524.1 cysteine desulfurase [Rhodoblastus sphagnicola]PPQ32760.1 cysteine desulfurase NifS [Rhodoblastus sphagnicola]
MTIYFDNSATTPVDPRVAEAMAPWHSAAFGNPSSLHALGRAAREAVEAAREQVAALIGAKAKEIVFVASGTEADNLALAGAFRASPSDRDGVIVSAIEHPAVLETAKALRSQGAALTLAPVDSDGLADTDWFRRHVSATTRIVSLMAANNVIGTVQPFAEVAAIARQAGALFHTDAVQAAGRIPLDVRAAPIDLLSISAHKLHGPKGVGALYVRDGVALAPIIHGGGQERGLRSATENVAGIVGFGWAAELAREQGAADNVRLVALRERLIEGVFAACPQAYVIGHRHRRLPGHVALAFSGQEGEAIRLMLALDEAGVAASTGSACSASHADEPSYVLRALGFDPFRARGALRLTLGRFNTEAEVDRVVSVLPGLVGGLRRIATARR